MTLTFNDDLLVVLLLKAHKKSKKKYVQDLLKSFGRQLQQETVRVTRNKTNPQTGEPLYTDVVVTTYQYAVVKSTKYGRIVDIQFKPRPPKVGGQPRKPSQPPTIIVKKKRVYTK